MADLKNDVVWKAQIGRDGALNAFLKKCMFEKNRIFEKKNRIFEKKRMFELVILELL